jgi:S1-C subfamily serine protease
MGKELFSRKAHLASIGYVIPSLLAIVLIGAGFFVYKLYSQTKQTQRETFNALQQTKKELSLLRSSASEALLRQQNKIDHQGKQLAEKNDSLRRMKAMGALLEKTLVNIEETRNSDSRNSSVSGSLLSEFAPSVVKVYCLSNSYSDHVQKGSGVLFRAARNNPKFPLYYVQTSLHVVKTIDRSVSQCRIALYPDTSDSDSYLLFKSKSHKSYAEDIDLAFIEPEMVTNNVHAGSKNDLVVYARDEAGSPLCQSVNMGDHLSILGYPGIGGETLTVTEGIVSGFEVDGRSRYVKTSAKTDRGNSGGVAIKSSGCIVGIPTFSRRGRVESIGRILDLNDLRRDTLKFLTLR